MKLDDFFLGITRHPYTALFSTHSSARQIKEDFSLVLNATTGEVALKASNPAVLSI